MLSELGSSHPSKRLFSRSNSGANQQGSLAHTSHVSSPKNPSVLTQQSPNVSSKTNLSSAPTSASALSSSAPPHFAYPATTTTTTATTSTTSTLPVLQYSAIVSQNTAPSSTNITTSNANASKPSPHVLSPPNKQQQQQGTRSMSNGNNNESSSIIGSHPPSLLATNSNVPVETSSSAHHDPLVSSQNLSLLTRSTGSENERTIPSFNSIPSNLISNGSSESHSSLMENPLGSIPNNSSSSSNLPGGGELSTPPNNTNGGVIGQLASGIPINPDHPSLRFVLPSNNSNSMPQQPPPTVPTGRVPLTPAEMRMLNRLNAAYTKLPSLLESERQRYGSSVSPFQSIDLIFLLEPMPIESMDEIHWDQVKSFPTIHKRHQLAAIQRNSTIALHLIRCSLSFTTWR